MEIFNNFLTGTLEANITNSQTTMTMVYSGGIGGTIPTFTNLTHSFRVKIDNELFQVTGSSFTSGIYTFTIVRASEGTTAASHTLGSQVHFVLTAGALFARWADNAMTLSSNRPDPYLPGRVFWPTDQPVAWYDTGSTWEPVGPIWSMPYTHLTILQSSFTSVNFTNASLAFSHQGIQYSPFFQANGAVGAPLGVRYRSAPATPYTVECLLVAAGQQFPTLGVFETGICFYNTSNTKYQTLGYNFSTGLMRLIGSRYTNHTTWASDDLAPIEMSTEQCRWLKLTNDGTTLKAWISADRMAWMEVWSVAVGTHMTPNAIGFYTKSEYYALTTYIHWAVY